MYCSTPVGHFARQWYGGLVRCAKLFTSLQVSRIFLLLTVSVCDTSNFPELYMCLVLFPVLMELNVPDGFQADPGLCLDSRQHQVWVLPFLNSRHFGRASLRLSHAAGSHRCENTIMWSISSCSVADKNQAWHILWLSVAPGLWPERKTMSCTETHLHNPHQVDHNSGTPLYLQKPPFQDWPTWIHIGLQDHWRYIYHLSAWLHIMNDDLPSSLGISMTKTVFLNPWLGQLTFFLYSNHLTLSYSTMVFYKDEKLESWWRVEAGKVL